MTVVQVSELVLPRRRWRLDLLAVNHSFIFCFAAENVRVDYLEGQRGYLGSELGGRFGCVHEFYVYVVREGGTAVLLYQLIDWV